MYYIYPCNFNNFDISVANEYFDYILLTFNSKFHNLQIDSLYSAKYKIYTIHY